MDDPPEDDNVWRCGYCQLLHSVGSFCFRTILEGASIYCPIPCVACHYSDGSVEHVCGHNKTADEAYLCHECPDCIETLALIASP